MCQVDAATSDWASEETHMKPTWFYRGPEGGPADCSLKQSHPAEPSLDQPRCSQPVGPWL